LPGIPTNENGSAAFTGEERSGNSRYIRNSKSKGGKTMTKAELISNVAKGKNKAPALARIIHEILLVS